MEDDGDIFALIKEECELDIVAYGLQENDYKNYFNEIDKGRIKLLQVDYDEKFITEEYIPKLEILTRCLKEGVFPCKQQE